MTMLKTLQAASVAGISSEIATIVGLSPCMFQSFISLTPNHLRGFPGDSLYGRIPNLRIASAAWRRALASELAAAALQEQERGGKGKQPEVAHK